MSRENRMARRTTPAANNKKSAKQAVLALSRRKSDRTTPDDVRILPRASVLSRTAPWAFRANLLVKVATATGNSLRGCASETVSGEKRDACSQWEETHASGLLVRAGQYRQPSPPHLEKQRCVVDVLHAPFRRPKTAGPQVAENKARAGSHPSPRRVIQAAWTGG